MAAFWRSVLCSSAKSELFRSVLCHSALLYLVQKTYNICACLTWQNTNTFLMCFCLSSICWSWNKGRWLQQGRISIRYLFTWITWEQPNKSYYDRSCKVLRKRHQAQLQVSGQWESDSNSVTIHLYLWHAWCPCCMQFFALTVLFGVQPPTSFPSPLLLDNNSCSRSRWQQWHQILKGLKVKQDTDGLLVTWTLGKVPLALPVPSSNNSMAI